MGKVSFDSKFHTDFENVSVLNYSETKRFVFFPSSSFFFLQIYTMIKGE